IRRVHAIEQTLGQAPSLRKFLASEQVHTAIGARFRQEIENAVMFEQEREGFVVRARQDGMRNLFRLQSIVDFQTGNSSSAFAIIEGFDEQPALSVLPPKERIGIVGAGGRFHIRALAVMGEKDGEMFLEPAAEAMDTCVAKISPSP